MRADRKEESERTWWEGNQTKAWRLFVAVFIAVMSFLSSWIFTSLDQTRTAVASLSDKYVVKSDFQCAVDRIEKTMENRFNSIEAEVKETNRYLRDKK